MLVDRKLGGVTIICSTEGGMEIEEVAESAPEKIIHVNVDSYTGLKSFHVQKISKALGSLKISKRFVKFTAVFVSGFFTAGRVHDRNKPISHNKDR